MLERERGEGGVGMVGVGEGAVVVEARMRQGSSSSVDEVVATTPATPAAAAAAAARTVHGRCMAAGTKPPSNIALWPSFIQSLLPSRRPHLNAHPPRTSHHNPYNPCFATHTHTPAPHTPLAECRNYEKKIKSFGGIELFLGGIGPDGHVAFNEPGSSLQSVTRIKVREETRLHAA